MQYSQTCQTVGQMINLIK